ncbi:MAG: methionine biosynthesis protein MetW [Thermoanaerobaculia bacterium]
MTSIVYRHPLVYELTMRVLYATHYRARLRVIGDLIEEGSSVVDLCCGPSALYRLELERKRVRYAGVDINAALLRRVAQRGAEAIEADIAQLDEYPKGDYLIMLGSLYHFLPEARAVVERMLRAASRAVIVSEPIRNLAGARSRIVRRLSARLANPGTASPEARFDEESLDALFAGFDGRVEKSFLIPGGREKVYLLRSGNHADIRGHPSRP